MGEPRRTRSALVGGSATKQLVPVLASLALVPATGKGGRALLMIVALSSQYFAVRMVHWIVVSILAESCLNFMMQIAPLNKTVTTRSWSEFPALGPLGRNRGISLSLPVAASR